MSDSDRSCLKLHMLLEDTPRIIPHWFPGAEMGHAFLKWVRLDTHWWRIIVSLVQIPFVTVSHHPRCFRNRPWRFVWIVALIWRVFRVITSRTYNRRCGVQLYQWVESLYWPPSVEAVVRALRNFWTKIWVVLRSRSNLILFRLGWESWLASNPCIWKLESSCEIGLRYVKLHQSSAYIHIRPEVVLVLSLSIEGVSRLRSDLPSRMPVIVELISDVIVGTLRCCLSYLTGAAYRSSQCQPSPSSCIS